jgi:MFS transporter, NNP family, nitrate/nitrite transporter
MRAFHWSWWTFFVAFFIWFAIAPLLSEIKKTLGLSKKQAWTSNIVGGTILVRFILGPLCDKYGARTLMALVLCLASIPTALTGAVNTLKGLCILRFFIGLAGGSFVMCQYWSSRMFTREVVGTANAITAGWGNLGGGVTQVVMGSMLFPLFKVFFDGDAEKAWRTVCVVPAIMTFASGVGVYYFSDDAPKGNYSELKMHGNMPEVSASKSFRAGAINFNSWILFLHYACCFGVEITMDNAAALYFKDEFGQSTESAAAIASIFGWMNLFSRGTGGYISDVANRKQGMRGRLIIQATFLALEGVFIFIFANSKDLAEAIVIMTIFSLFCQGATGTTFGIVPYVDPSATGSISGIVGAGGNIGAVGFGLCFRQLNYKDAFYIMGGCVLASSLTSAMILIKGQSNFFRGEETVAIKNTGTLAIPDKHIVHDVDDETSEKA